jgi:hypothetical protein
LELQVPSAGQKLADNGMISPRSVPTKQWRVIDSLRSLAPSSEASSSTKGIQKLDARSGLGLLELHWSARLSIFDRHESPSISVPQQFCEKYGADHEKKCRGNSGLENPYRTTVVQRFGEKELREN